MESNNFLVATDIGTANVAVVVGNRNADGEVHIVASSIKPAEGVIRGEIRNVEEIARSIKAAYDDIENRTGLAVTNTFTGVSGEHVRCAKNSYYVYVGRDRDGEICSEDVRHLSESMRNVQAPEGDKILHIIPQSYIVDGQEEVANPVGMFGKQLEGIFNFVIANNTITSRISRALNKLGVNQTKVFVNPLAMAEAVTLPDEKELGVAVVDIGAGTTDVCIYLDGIVRYVGVIPLGAEALNKDIRAQGILDRHVEELKVKYGSALSDLVTVDKLIKVPGRTPRDPKEISFRNLALIIEARLMDIADFIKEEINSAGYEGRLGAGIVLTGGCAHLRDIEVLMQRATGLDVRVASPEISVDEASREVASDCRLATAVGLLLKATESGAEIQPVKIAPRVNPVGTSFARQQASGNRPPAIRVPEKKAPADTEEGDEFDDSDPDEEKEGRESWFRKTVKKFGGLLDSQVIDDEI